MRRPANSLAPLHSGGLIGTMILPWNCLRLHELYQQMNGMPLREMDNIVYPVCKLCRDHERAGFVEGIRLGVLLAHELSGVEL